MGSSAGARALLAGALLCGCGATAALAAQRGLWASLTGALLVAAWQLALLRAEMGRTRAVAPSIAAGPAGSTLPPLLLDAAPTPLLEIEPGGARALNRAARRLFATDARVLPPPAALLDATATHLLHENRAWRIDRVAVSPTRAVAALIDVEQEERAAEARAGAEMIHVLGHELLNGLAPIASLAESGVAALRAPAADPMLLADILATLARRAEALQRFAESYHALARLPAPVRTDTDLAALARDLARLFAGRWPEVPLTLATAFDARASVDPDQLSQAIWALLQNAAEAARAADAPQVTLRVVRAAAATIVEVSDSGAGVPPGDTARIFRPFYSSKVGGSGVGLSLARQVAFTHGGTLTLVESAPTTFRLTLP
ncbi:PAS domain-containing sensor histidine kinase [Sphingomonas sp. BK345]|uniref:sensor histidine kinase n=1 Tax=Sphingomonas sp. BK345 TaxID=2586980 RepID=UPI001618248E|nr:HAMP domain-containing sensor histidine kinase [Sphingomonas sp. BK345]MBB3475429.1 signal transduction histidine kinase [Sphingomonas sp. BK345]